MDESCAGLLRFAHQSADLPPARAQLIAVTRVFAKSGLSNGQPHTFGHFLSCWSRTEVPEGSSVGLACLSSSGANPALEVLVRCHLAFHVTSEIPQRPHPRRTD